MPAGLRRAILSIAEEIGSPRLLAVRSSATAEDLVSASFAGQYRSFLGIGDADEVLRAVRLVWASLWSPTVRAYRRHRAIADADVAMGVVVMRQVDAVHAGVRSPRSRVVRADGCASSGSRAWRTGWSRERAPRRWPRSPARNRARSRTGRAGCSRRWRGLEVVMDRCPAIELEQGSGERAPA